MENFIFEDNQQPAKSITQKVKSLAPADFPIALNQVMTGQSLGQAKAIALLLQKNVDLEKLLDVKILQAQMRDIARRYLDDYIPKILTLFIEVTGFYNFFASYYPDIEESFNALNQADENEKAGSMADMAEGIQDLINFIAAKKNKSSELVISLQKYNQDQLVLADKLKNTKNSAEQLYIGEKTEIGALHALQKELAKEINENNAQIASGALHSAKNILKISTSLITEYTPDKTPQAKPNLPKPEAKATKETKAESIPIIGSNLQAFSNNKPVPSIYQEKLQHTLTLYRECIEKLKKYSIEATIYEALIQQWDSFTDSMRLLEGSVKYLAIAWQGLEKNFFTLKQKLIYRTDLDLDTDDIEYIKQQWSLTHDDLILLYEKAINFQHSASLEVVSTIESYDRSILGIPQVKNGRFMQRIIAENSKK
jgi:Bacillus haemolytic enterotoxin (HBL)